MLSKRNRHHKKTLNDSIEALKHQMQQNGLISDNQPILLDVEGPKLSAVLLEFIAPYEQDAPTDDAFEKLITIAVIAWNAAILEGKERQRLINSTVGVIAKTAGKSWGKDTKDIIAMLMQRKEKFFADDKRIIVDCKVSRFGDGRRHLTVASFVPSDDHLD